MNTKFKYMYRDGSNWKTSWQYIFEGEITPEQKEAVISSCDGENFIAEQIGLYHPGLPDKITEDDHCWCELDADCFSYTSEPADAPYSLDELVSQFVSSANHWNDVKYAIMPESETDEEE